MLSYYRPLSPPPEPEPEQLVFGPLAASYPPDGYKQPWGVPIAPEVIPYQDLTPVAPEHSKNPEVLIPDAEERFHANARAHCTWHEERGYNQRSWMRGLKEYGWKNAMLRAPYEHLIESFTFQELVWLWVGSVVMTSLTDAIEKREPFLWKVQNALWQYGGQNDYNSIVSVITGLRRLRAPDGFELKLTHTRSINTHGSAEHVPGLYLDAAFGALLYHQGKHVMTIGFSPHREAVVVAQVQLRNKKGNRFLFRLDGHYLDVALEILAKAFPDRDLYLVDGSSAVAAIRRSYGNKPCTMTSVDEARIAGLYDRPLAGYERTGESRQSQCRKYMQLRAKQAEPLAERNEP